MYLRFKSRFQLFILVTLNWFSIVIMSCKNYANDFLRALLFLRTSSAPKVYGASSSWSLPSMPQCYIHFNFRYQMVWIIPLSNLPNNCADLITEVWEKTLIDVLWIFLVSENYIAWLTWFLVFTSYRGYQELSQSSKIIFTSQKYSQNIDQGFLHKVR